MNAFMPLIRDFLVSAKIRELANQTVMNFKFLSSAEHKRTQLFVYPILQNIFFCVQQKREIHTSGTT